jgi:hypothetical protein
MGKVLQEEQKVQRKIAALRNKKEGERGPPML